MSVDLKEHIELQASHIVATRDIATHVATIAARDATIVELTSKLADAEARATAAASTDAAKLKADLDLTLALVDEIGGAVLAATGKAATKLPEVISDRVELIRKARTELAASLTVGGVSANPKAVDTAITPKSNAFKRS